MQVFRNSGWWMNWLKSNEDWMNWFLLPCTPQQPTCDQVSKKKTTALAWPRQLLPRKRKGRPAAILISREDTWPSRKFLRDQSTTCHLCQGFREVFHHHTTRGQMPWGISAKKWIHKNGIQSPFRKLPSEIQPIVNMDRDTVLGFRSGLALSESINNRN